MLVNKGRNFFAFIRVTVYCHIFSFEITNDKSISVSYHDNSYGMALLSRLKKGTARRYNFPRKLK